MFSFMRAFLHCLFKRSCSIRPFFRTNRHYPDSCPVSACCAARMHYGSTEDDYDVLICTACGREAWEGDAFHKLAHGSHEQVQDLLDYGLCSNDEAQAAFDRLSRAEQMTLFSDDHDDKDSSDEESRPRDLISRGKCAYGCGNYATPNDIFCRWCRKEFDSESDPSLEWDAGLADRAWDAIAAGALS